MILLQDFGIWSAFLKNAATKGGQFTILIIFVIHPERACIPSSLPLRTCDFSLWSSTTSHRVILLSFPRIASLLPSKKNYNRCCRRVSIHGVVQIYRKPYSRSKLVLGDQEHLPLANWINGWRRVERRSCGSWHPHSHYRRMLIIRMGYREAEFTFGPSGQHRLDSFGIWLQFSLRSRNCVRSEGTNFPWVNPQELGWLVKQCPHTPSLDCTTWHQKLSFVSTTVSSLRTHPYYDFFTHRAWPIIAALSRYLWDDVSTYHILAFVDCKSILWRFSTIRYRCSTHKNVAWRVCWGPLPMGFDQNSMEKSLRGQSTHSQPLDLFHTVWL